MCVICYKKSGEKLPSESVIEDMWYANPDGAGAMWMGVDGAVHVKKGFMKLEDFLSWFKESREVLENADAAFHFRISTHGTTSPKNCHPFPVGTGEECHALEWVGESALMHNGVLDLVPREGDFSDSAELAMMAAESGVGAEKAVSMFSPFFGSNKVILFSSGRVSMFGPWKKSGGLLFSNLNHERFPWCWQQQTKGGVKGGKKKGAESFPVDEFGQDEWDDWQDYLDEEREAGFVPAEEVRNTAEYLGVTDALNDDLTLDLAALRDAYELCDEDMEYFSHWEKWIGTKDVPWDYDQFVSLEERTGREAKCAEKRSA